MNLDKNPANPECCLCGGGLELAPSGKYYDTHNADPVSEGDCCAACNAFVVIPARATQKNSITKNTTEMN